MGNFEIPDILPAMVLREVVFFPQSILPLYVFEDHYRKMLDEVIKGDRMFTIVNSTPDDLTSNPIAAFKETTTLGFVKACQTYADGTSMVMLEGICRLTVQQYLSDAPFLKLRVTPLNEASSDPVALETLRNKTLELLEKIHLQGGEISGEAIQHLRQINTPQHFVDHAAASFLKNMDATQTLLKCSDPIQRYSSLLTHLRSYYQRIELINSIVGNLNPDDIQLN